MIYKKNNHLLLLTALSVVMLFLTAFAKPKQLATSHYTQVKSVQDTIPGDPDTSIDGKIFEAVEEEAYFPGGEKAWRSWLEQNLDPAAPIVKGAPAGLYTVYIQFVVDRDGKVSAIKPLTKHGYGMEAEVMRILRKSPPWIPAVQNKRTVRAYRKQPVTFQVEEEKPKKRRRG